MSVQAHIIRAFNRLGIDELLTTRQLLGWGSRAAVDQATYQLVKSGWIIRVARGVFMRKGSRMPTVLEVAKAKAQAFGKQVYEHGANIAKQLGFAPREGRRTTFLCTGRSSSFRFGKIVIRFVGTSPRKLAGGDALSGKAIRAMWNLGKNTCTPEMLSSTYSNWGPAEEEIHELASLLPEWMNNLFYWGKREERVSRRRTLTFCGSADFFDVFSDFKHLFRNELTQKEPTADG